MYDLFTKLKEEIVEEIDNLKEEEFRKLSHFHHNISGIFATQREKKSIFLLFYLLKLVIKNEHSLV